MAKVYLVPSLLHEEGSASLPVYLLDAIRECQAFFVENERTTRRYFKQLWRTYRPQEPFIIDDYEWQLIDENSLNRFRQLLQEGKTIGIVSEAGCPGVADPGQALVQVAQEMAITVKPLVGPSSILLALMASGMNGQQFRFAGYLPIDNQERTKVIRELEAESIKKNCTQIFIETPYRNNQLMEALLRSCQPATRICIAVELTGPGELIQTRTVAYWKNHPIDMHKKPAIFLLQGN